MSTIAARRSQAQKNLPSNGYPQRPPQYRETFSETEIENSPGLGHNRPPSDVAGEDEAVKFLYVQLHIGDYITGTMGMTPELEGAYCRFLIRLYQRGRAFPDNDKMMCAAMGLSIRVWKRLKDALLTLGKIIMRNGCLTNDRFEKERLKRAEQLRKQADAAHKRHARERAERNSLAKVSPKFEGSLDETSGKQSTNFAKKSNEINETGVTGPWNPRILESSNQESLSVVIGAEELLQRLTKAAGTALANYAVCPGLLAVTEPRRWLEQGCDLELDVLPTLRARTARVRQGTIRSWTYFTQAVMDAHATRLEPLQKGNPILSHGGGGDYARNGAYAGRTL